MHNPLKHRVCVQIGKNECFYRIILAKSLSDNARVIGTPADTVELRAKLYVHLFEISFKLLM